MSLKNTIPILCGFLFIFAPFICLAQNCDSSALFCGRINANNINVRSDSTVTADVICTLNKGEIVGVRRESYKWYKIKLPKRSPSYVRKDMVAVMDDKTARIIKANVNIRLTPEESSAILGRAGRNEVINILGESGQWYKIEPVDNSFGWVHKNFVERVSLPEVVLPAGEAGREEKVAAEMPADTITVEGVIRPYGKVFRRIATHKLIAADKKVYLLKGNKENLDSLCYHNVKITGKPVPAKKQRYAIIEIFKIEALD